MSVVLHRALLFADLNDVFGLQRFVARAAFGVKELQQLLKRFGVCRVMQERAFAADADELFVSSAFRDDARGWSSECPVPAWMSPTIMPSG